MTGATVALFAHSPERENADLLARDTLLFATAFLMAGNRLLVHAPPVVLLPLLLGAESGRSRLVVESAERAPPPLILMPARESEGPETALYRPLPDTEAGDLPPSSLLDRLAALGFIDDRWRQRADVEPRHILAAEQPVTIAAIGWSDEMHDLCEAAEGYSGRAQIPLIVVDHSSSPLAERKGWTSALSLAVERLGSQSGVMDSYRAEDDNGGRELEGPGFHEADQEAWREARLVIVAEALAEMMSR